jgi:hypothetical protein
LGRQRTGVGFAGRGSEVFFVGSQDEMDSPWLRAGCFCFFVILGIEPAADSLKTRKKETTPHGCTNHRLGFYHDKQFFAQVSHF